jgi:N-acetylmuramoyl-L-alanine amidase
MGALEKDLTLAIARKLRTTLQSQLATTVLLTRDSDVPLTSEARSAAANNNQADLFLSLHIGTSLNKADFGCSVYVIQDNFAATLLPEEKGQRLFLPWYMGYRKNRQWSVEIASMLSEDLGRDLPGWTFPVRTGPVGVLASATMPSVLIEIGNLNNPASLQALLDNTFQQKISVTIAGAIERFSAARQAGQ